MEKDNKVTQTISISVRTLVEFVLRSGSIDTRFGGFDRAQLGAQIHRRIQKQAGKGYTPEVSLKDETCCGDTLFVVQGRADGIIRNENGFTIDEIKSTAVDLDDIETGKPVHWAQVKCYGWFMAKKEHLKAVTLRLTYVHFETKEMRIIEQSASYEDLNVFYENLLSQWLKWVRMENCWRMKRNERLKEMDFPYPDYRKGQREMAVAVYNTIRRRERLFCQAPTGIGKTLSVLFPTLKAMSSGLTEKIVYLTAKTMTGRAAEAALSQMAEQGVLVRSLTLTAKDKLCFLEERACNPEDCPYAKGYYDRINDHVFELLGQYNGFTREIIEKEAENRQLCPFELAIDLAPWCDVIIGDVNYLFDPVVALTMLTEGAIDPVFLLDEAHNLVDRSRSMYSASLNKTAFMDLKKQLNAKDKPLYKAVSKINESFIDLRKSAGEQKDYSIKEPLLTLNEALTVFIYSYESWRKKHPTHPAGETALSLYFEVRRYLLMAEYYGDNYVTTIFCGRREVRVTQLCLDASEIIHSTLSKGRSAILFSATLSPISYFRKVLGGEEAKYIQLPSPFDPRRFRIMAADRISTRYVDRENSMSMVSEMIKAFISGHVGNYMIFFPSYRYMNNVRSVFENESDLCDIIVQQSEMTEEERDEFLSQLRPKPRTTTVAFCITGGIFGEGIDLKGDRLSGVVIVGVGMPQLCRERDLLRDYYNEINSKGFEYAYRNPGMIRVMQAMGRVIRDSEDRGMALLIDDRFGQSAYGQLLPAYFQPDVFVRTAEEIEKEAKRFWN